MIVFGGHARIRFNQIFANGSLAADDPSSGGGSDALGIDLDPFGVTANDAVDGDTGANNLQNFPVVSSVSNSANGTTITGTLNSTAGTTFAIDFYSNVAGTSLLSAHGIVTWGACDASGYGEGQTYIGTTTATTDQSGNGTFSYTASTALAPGAVVTATATDPDGNTSEFSKCPNTTSAPGTIIVSKRTVPSGSSQSFAFAASYNSTGFSLTDGQSNTSAPLAPGTHSVNETPASGWDSSATCSDGSSPSNINLTAGETVACTFTKTQRGTVAVKKTVTGVPPSGSQSFDFQLRQNASTSSDGTILDASTANALNGGSFTFTGTSSPPHSTTTTTTSSADVANAHNFSGRASPSGASVPIAERAGIPISGRRRTPSSRPPGAAIRSGPRNAI